MKNLAPLGCFLLLLVAACDREQGNTTFPAKAQRATAHDRMAPSAPLPETAVRANPVVRQVEALADRLPTVPDEELEAVLQSVAEEDNPSVRQELLATLYEETRMRPPTIRLPFLLEIARCGDAHPSVRATIMAELGTTLQASYGTSWADWALALEEHLADTEGLIRVE